MMEPSQFQIIVIIGLLVCFLTICSLAFFVVHFLVKEKKKVEYLPREYPTAIMDLTSKVFVSFPCSECNETLVIENFIMPGDVAVIDCANCNISWTVYSPSLIIKQTQDLPEPIKGMVAKILSEPA